jgi:hypothetical protein
MPVRAIRNQSCGGNQAIAEAGGTSTQAKARVPSVLAARKYAGVG